MPARGIKNNHEGEARGIHFYLESKAKRTRVCSPSGEQCFLPRCIKNKDRFLHLIFTIAILIFQKSKSNSRNLAGRKESFSARKYPLRAEKKPGQKNAVFCPLFTDFPGRKTVFLIHRRKKYSYED